MSKLLSEWEPSASALDLLNINGVSQKQIENAIAYLKSQVELESIDDVDGYDNWNAFFIMFCIKLNNQNVQ